MIVRRFRPWNWLTHETDARNLPVRQTDQRYGVSPLEDLHSELDRMLDRAFQGFWPGRGTPPAQREAAPQGFLKPRLDVSVTDAEYAVSVELPGVSEKDVSIEVEDHALVISGEKKNENEAKDAEKGWYRVERSYGSFRRMLALPEDANAEGIKAAYKDGILKISIPRVEPKPNEKKRIEISTE